jgi:dihydroxyacetone kinase
LATLSNRLYLPAAQLSQKRGLVVVRNYFGNYRTSLEMAGLSLTLIRLDDEIGSLLAAPGRNSAPNFLTKISEDFYNYIRQNGS